MRKHTVDPLRAQVTSGPELVSSGTGLPKQAVLPGSMVTAVLFIRSRVSW